LAAPKNLSPAELSLRGSLGAAALHAKGGTNTRAAFEARMEKYRQQVDPTGSLTPEEREKRAEHARRADMIRMSLKAAKARRLRKQAAELEAEAEQGLKEVGAT
jgi:hypothetical protein